MVARPEPDRAALMEHGCDALGYVLYGRVLGPHGLCWFDGRDLGGEPRMVLDPCGRVTYL